MEFDNGMSDEGFVLLRMKVKDLFRVLWHNLNSSATYPQLSTLPSLYSSREEGKEVRVCVVVRENSTDAAHTDTSQGQAISGFLCQKPCIIEVLIAEQFFLLGCGFPKQSICGKLFSLCMRNREFCWLVFTFLYLMHPSSAMVTWYTEVYIVHGDLRSPLTVAP